MSLTSSYCAASPAAVGVFGLRDILAYLETKSSSPNVLVCCKPSASRPKNVAIKATAAALIEMVIVADRFRHSTGDSSRAATKGLTCRSRLS